MEEYIKQAIEAEASDVFLAAGSQAAMRVNGQIKNLSEKDLASSDIKDYYWSKLSEAQKEEFDQVKDLDIRDEIDGTSMRVNLHQQADGLSSSIRIFPNEIATLDQIRLEDVIKEKATTAHGLILITGPTGSGKSTTITSLLEKINQEESKHIITIEDPVEMVFEDKKSIIEQRNVNIDTPTFHSALKYVLRQDPDIIFLGEMRDKESVAAALTAAETGHLVFSTLHTPTAADTIERIIDLFPGDKKRQILVQLSSVLKMVVSQRLIPTIEEGRVAAREILLNNSAVANLIKNNNVAQINSVIQTNKDMGMKTMERSIKELIEEGLIEDKKYNFLENKDNN